MEKIVGEVLHLFETGDINKSIELAVNYIENNTANNKNIATLVHLYNDLTMFFHDTKNTKKAIFYAKKGIELANSFNYLEILASQYMRLANVYGKFHINDQALFFLKKAKQIAQQTNNREILPSIQFNIASLYFDLGKIQKSLDIISPILEDNNYVLKPKVYSYHNLLASNCFAHLKNYKAALLYSLKGLENAKFDNDFLWQEKVKIPIYYSCLGEMEKAQELLKSLENKIEQISENEEILSTYQYAWGLFYKQSKDFNNALRFLEKAIEFPFTEFHFEIYSDLISCYHSLGMHQKAIVLSDEYLKSANRYYVKERAKRLLKMSAFLELREAESEADKSKVLFDQEKRYRTNIEAEKIKFDELLSNILPQQAVIELKENDFVKPQKYESVSVLFAELVNLNTILDNKCPEEVIELLNEIITAFDKLAIAHKIERIKTIGSTYMAVAGVPLPNDKHLTNIMAFAQSILKELSKFNKNKNTDIKLKIGVDSGSLIAGVVGHRKFAYDVWGDTVNTAARMQSYGLTGKIQCTNKVYEQLKETYTFENRGMIDIKGKGKMNTWFFVIRK